MSNRGSQRPPPSAVDDDPLDPPEERDARRGDFDDRSSLERILPELIRRGLEAGRGPLGRMSESRFPRDLAQGLVAQLGDARTGIVRAVAQEVGRFLREADIAAELRRVLAGLDVEATVRLRFNQREDGSLATEIETELHDEDHGDDDDEHDDGEHHEGGR